MSEAKLSPWLHGVIDTLVGAEVLRTSTIPNRNRLAVILIDSAFETACRAFLQHKEKIKLQETHRPRDNLSSGADLRGQTPLFCSRMVIRRLASEARDSEGQA